MSDENPRSLGESLPAEMTRVRALVTQYRDPILGGAGELAARMMDHALSQAQKALAEGDVIAMLRAHEELKGFTG